MIVNAQDNGNVATNSFKNNLNEGKAHGSNVCVSFVVYSNGI